MCIRDRETEKQITETKQRLDKNEETIGQFRMEIDARMDRGEHSNQVRIMSIQQENQDQLNGMKSNIADKLTNFNDKIEHVKNQVNNQGEKIENLHFQVNIQGEIE